MRRRSVLGAIASLAILAGAPATVALGSPGQSGSAGAADEVRERLKVSIANVGGVAIPQVGAMLDERQPDVMVISEAYNAREHLAVVAENKGYVLRQFGPDSGAEAPGIALLVRGDVTIVDRVALTMSEPWYFRGSCTAALNQRAPRVFPAVTLQVGSSVWRVIGVHFPPGGPAGGSCNTGGQNGPAWQESKQAVQAYAANHPDARVIAAGDFNATANEMSSQFPGFSLKAGSKVDHAISREGRGVSFDWVNSNSAQSGHGWNTFGLSFPAG